MSTTQRSDSPYHHASCPPRLVPAEGLIKATRRIAELEIQAGRAERELEAERSENRMIRERLEQYERARLRALEVSDAVAAPELALLSRALARSEQVLRETKRAQMEQRDAAWSDISCLNGQLAEKDAQISSLLAELDASQPETPEAVAAHSQAPLLAKEKQLLGVWMLAYAQHCYIVQQYDPSGMYAAAIAHRYRAELESTSGAGANIIKSLPIPSAQT